MDDRRGIRRAQGLDDPDRPHGRSYRRSPRRAAAAYRPGAGMTWRVVVADRVAASGLDPLSKTPDLDAVASSALVLLPRTPDLEVVDVAGKPAELDKAIAGAHALLVRSETRVTA